ncbi:unnamed protein product, partial [Ectocarpus sp. 6 AP-2014]
PTQHRRQGQRRGRILHAEGQDAGNAEEDGLVHSTMSSHNALAHFSLAFVAKPTGSSTDDLQHRPAYSSLDCGFADLFVVNHGKWESVLEARQPWKRRWRYCWRVSPRVTPGRKLIFREHTAGG